MVLVATNVMVWNARQQQTRKHKHLLRKPAIVLLNLALSQESHWLLRLSYRLLSLNLKNIAVAAAIRLLFNWYTKTVLYNRRMGLFDDFADIAKELRGIKSDIAEEFGGLKQDIVSSVADIKTGASETVNDVKQKAQSAVNIGDILTNKPPINSQPSNDSSINQGNSPTNWTNHKKLLIKTTARIFSVFSSWSRSITIMDQLRDGSETYAINNDTNQLADS